MSILIDVEHPALNVTSIKGETATEKRSMKQNTGHRWIIHWQDRDPYRSFTVTADAVAEAQEAIEQTLKGQTWTPEDADEIGGDETEPAYQALVRDEFDGDILDGLLTMREPVEFACDEGKLAIEREF